MFFKYAILFCVFLLFVDTNAFVRVSLTSSSTTEPSPFESLRKNMDAFRSCVDQTLTNVVGGINEKQLEPLFNVIGDHINRFARAFDVITSHDDNTPSRYSKYREEMETKPHDVD